jgi:hypothetical protein
MGTLALGSDFQRVHASSAMLRIQKQHIRLWASCHSHLTPTSCSAAPPETLSPVSWPTRGIQRERDPQQLWQRPHDDIVCREVNALLAAQVSIPGILAIVQSHINSFNAVNVATAFQRIAKVCIYHSKGSVIE